MARFASRLGLGTVFTLIIVFFIFLYARERMVQHWGWTVLTYIAGGYLLISLGLLALIILIPILIILIALLTMRKRKRRKVIDVEAEVQEK
jgi:4-amino-4-deoxy-L-arabinose transferase-like glycosyltransferase